MIEFHYWPTANAHKISLMLEETGIPYEIKAVNIGKGDQFDPQFARISPNNRMPAIVDTEPEGGMAPVSVFESGAILIYLAEKTGQFYAAGPWRFEIMQWLFWQTSGLGPMAGQYFHFRKYAPEELAYAIDRYSREVNRLFGVLERRLSDRAFVAGPDYSIADMAIYPWIEPHERLGQSIATFPHINRWLAAIRARPATARAYEVGKSLNAGPIGAAEAKILFGQTAQSARTN